MQWLSLHIDADHAGLQQVIDFLSTLGIDEVTIDDETEFQEFLEENRPHWDYVDAALTAQMRGRSRVTFYLPADESGFSRLAEVRIALQKWKEQVNGYGTLLMTLDEMEDADWENNWKQYYRPTPVGKRLHIVPKWEQTSAEGRINLVLDPGLTFGTGSHASTQLCLKALEARDLQGFRVLDLGCGSGILSIAALLLGAKSVLGVDIDDKCQTVAVENAALNGIGSDTFNVLIGDILTDTALRDRIGGGYDVVLANIVADVILGLCPLAETLLRPNGWFICSGVIDTREEEVASALRKAGLTVWEVQRQDGWCAFYCQLV